MKHLSTIFFLLLLTIIVTGQVQATIPADAYDDWSKEQEITVFTWEHAAIAVESNILKSMLDLAANKRWDAAKAHLEVYREIGSCPNAAIAIGAMLIKKNKDGATAVIKLTNEELIAPRKGPITSTRQVKRSFMRGIQAAAKQESKETLLTTFLNIFTIDGLTPSEKTAMNELKKVVGEGLLKTAAILERILLVLIEEIGNESPLDERSVSQISE